MADSSIVDKLLAQKRVRTIDYWVPFDADEAIACELARIDAERARSKIDVNVKVADLRGKPSAAEVAAGELEAKHAELLDALRQHSAHFVCRALGRRDYRALMDAHRPTDEQVAAAKTAGRVAPALNEDAFKVALVGACARLAVVNDDGESGLEALSEAQVTAIWDSVDWNTAELEQLFAACYDVNQTRRVVDMGKGSGGTLGLARS